MSALTELQPNVRARHFDSPTVIRLADTAGRFMSGADALELARALVTILAMDRGTPVDCVARELVETRRAYGQLAVPAQSVDSLIDWMAWAWLTRDQS